MRAVLNLGTLVALVVTGSPSSRGQSYEMNWHTVDGGGTLWTSAGAFTLSGTFGQCDAGAPMSAGGFTLVGGFWPGTMTGAPQPSDCDGDGDVDLADYSGFKGCMAGPVFPPSSGCDCYELDGSGTVDLLDFAEIQVQFTGAP